MTLVPERPQELTTEGGLDVVAHAAAAKDFIRQMHDAGMRVSIFLDADADQVRAGESGGRRRDRDQHRALRRRQGRHAGTAELARIAEAARLAVSLDLEVLAGHGLNYTNVIPIVAIREIVELNIGHSIVARAAIVGMDRAVRDMVALL